MLADLIFSPLLWISLAALGVGSLLRKVLHVRQLYKRLSVLPQEKEFSLLLGTVQKFPPPTDAPGLVKYLSSWYGASRRMFLVWLTPLRPVLFVYHPEPAKCILQSAEPKPLAVGDVFALVKDWLGEGLLLSNGSHWHRSRHLLTPAFHFDILRPYVDVYNAAADIMLEKIGEYADKGVSFDIYPMMKLCTFDIILKCSMSIDLDVQRKQNDVHYMQSCERLAELWGQRLLNVFQHPDCVFYLTSNGRQFKKHCDIVHHFAEDIISKRRQILEKEGPPEKRYMDFVDILLMAKDETGKGLTLQEMRAEVDTFLFAGHETSSTAVTWLFYLLSTHPQCQQQAQDEVDAVLLDKESTDIMWSDLSKLEYLTCCVKEALRLYPSVPGVLKLLTKDVELDGLTIPAGTRVSVNFYLLHRNPDVHDNPDDFFPERFQLENARERDPFAFAPFSAGPRNCIGQNFALNEIKVLAAKLLSKFVLRHDTKYPIRLSTNPVVHSETGIWVYAQRR